MTEKKYFTNLDAIRFIAATMVYAQHGLSKSFAKLNLGIVFTHIITVLCNGGTGVTIFFVLSGFLITFFLVLEHDNNGKINIQKFYLRRVLRIWPLYYAVLLFTFIVYPLLKTIVHLNHPLCSNILYHISFLSNFDVINVEKHCPGNEALSQNTTWSVSVEEQFYLFWPLIFIVTPKKIWLYAVLLISGISLWFRIVNISDNEILYFHTISVLIYLAVGGFFALSINQSAKLRSFFESVGTLYHTVFFILATGFLFCDNVFFALPYGKAFYALLTAVCFGLIIASQALTKNDSVLNLGNFKFASSYGKYTYGMYLLHSIVITLLDVVVRVLKVKTDSFYQSFLTGIVGFVITLFVSKLSYQTFESRFFKFKEEKFSGLN